MTAEEGKRLSALVATLGVVLLLAAHCVAHGKLDVWLLRELGTLALLVWLFRGAEAARWLVLAGSCFALLVGGVHFVRWVAHWAFVQQMSEWQLFSGLCLVLGLLAMAFVIARLLWLPLTPQQKKRRRLRRALKRTLREREQVLKRHEDQWLDVDDLGLRLPDASGRSSEV